MENRNEKYLSALHFLKLAIQKNHVVYEDSAFKNQELVLQDFTPYVFMAVRLKRDSIVEYFLNNGINSNLIDENGDTLIIWAARLGNEKMVEMLLKAGAEPLFENKIGKCAFDYAYKQEIWDLLAQRRLNKEEISGRTFDLSLKAIQCGLDKEAKTLRAVAADMGNENAERIENTFAKNNGLFTSLSNVNKNNNNTHNTQSDFRPENGSKCDNH